MRKPILSGLYTSETNTVDVWVRAGQSGQRGTNNNVTPPVNVPNVNAQITGWDLSSGMNFFLNEFETMDFAQSTFVGNLYGAENNIATLHSPQEMYFVKCVAGGTSLGNNWAMGSQLRNELINSINYAKNYFSSNNIAVRWIWSWNQWETDSPNDTFSTRYYRNYTDFITDLFDNTGVSFDEHLIIGVSTQSNFYTNHTTNCDKIIQAQIDAANLYGGTVINQSDLATWDGVHLTAANYDVLGSREYNAVNT